VFAARSVGVGTVMKRFAVVTSLKGRTEQYMASRQYLERAMFGHDVKCYVREDTQGDDVPFHKAKLLNEAIDSMNDDWNVFVQLDADVCLRGTIFDDLEVLHEKSFAFLGGVKLTEEASHEIERVIPPWQEMFDKEVDPESINLNRRQGYVGMVVLHRELFETARGFLGGKLYDERFVGWGGEDSVISFLSRDMQARGMCKREYIFDAWRHLWHTDAPEKNDPRIKSKRDKLFRGIVDMNRGKLCDLKS